MILDKINQLIAKEKGWSEKVQFGQVYGYYSPEGYIRPTLPNYAGDLTTAYELVDEMRTAGSHPGPFGGERWASVTLTTTDWRWLDNPNTHPKYSCVFRVKNKGTWVSGSAKSASLAICLCWLSWKGIKYDE